ncbi:MAG TPA: hypothetical protein DC024_06940 [Clostridiales bacterium]|nr:hypothetical protein [Clostridiales bacterium]
MSIMSEGLVDFHTHILSEMDDGAKSLSESNQMLKMLVQQGVDTVCLTPHFYPYKESMESFVTRRKKSFEKLMPSGKKLGIKFVLSSETFLNDYLFHTEDITPICMNDSNGDYYLLTELPLQSSFSERTINRISKLIDTYSVHPILAHIERYPKLVKHKTIINQLIDMGCLMQINLSSLQKGFFLKRKLLRYFSDNLIHVVGTDSHNMEHRQPDYKSGIEILQKSLGDKMVKQISQNARQIISGCTI